MFSSFGKQEEDNYLYLVFNLGFPISKKCFKTLKIYTVPEGAVRLFGVPESGKDIFSRHISKKLEIKLNQNPRSSCTSTNEIEENQWQLDLAFRG